MTTILLVDDDPDLVEANRAVLSHMGFTVVSAGSLEEARRWLKTGTADLVVLDVMMETQTAGFELARELNDKHPALPILMLTGLRKAMDIPFRFEPDETWLPVVQFIEKPFEAAALGAKVREILGAAS